MKKIFVLMMAIALTGVFTSCNKIPQVEMDAATAALEQARTAQADVYLVTDYMALQDSLSKINVEIESQKGKFIGNYKVSKEKLAAVSAQANELVTKTETRKQEIKTEVATAQTKIAEIMAENNQLIEMAPKGKEGKQAIEAISSDLNMINVSVSEVPALVEQGDLMAAQTKINAAQQKATEINTELKTVMEKYTKK